MPTHLAGSTNFQRTANNFSLSANGVGGEGRGEVVRSINLILTLALNLAFSPGRRNSNGAFLIVRMIVRQIQLREFSWGRRTFLLSLAHRMGEGGRRPGEGMSLVGVRFGAVNFNRLCHIERKCV